MPNKNAFWKHLSGQNAQGFVGGAVDYSAQATYALFQANAAAGELGVYNADTNALIAGSGPAAGTLRIFFAVKRDGATERSTAFKIQDITSNRTPYSAPVKQVTTITLGTGTVIQDISYTNITSNPVTITYVVAGNSTALTIVVTGNAIVVNLATSGGGAATTTATLLAAAIAASAAASALVTATITGTAATVQAAQSLVTLGTFVVASGQYELDFLEFTPGNQPFPTYDYNYVTNNGDSVDTIGTKLTAAINNTALIDNQNRDQIITAVYSAAAKTITVTAINFGVSFKALPKYALAGALVVNTTAMHAGAGYPEQAQLFEDEFIIQKGVTTNYPEQGQSAADWGKPTSLVSAALTYNIYTFTGYNREQSKTPYREQKHEYSIVVILPASGASAEEEVKAIFAL